MTTTSPLQTAATFPQVEVENRLREHLTALVRQQANVKGQALPTERNVLLTAAVDIDSLGVVEILCVLDDVLEPVLVDESVVRAGGYSSIQEAVSDLVPKIENRWRKHNERRKS
jgi:hypothetical protein